MRGTYVSPNLAFASGARCSLCSTPCPDLFIYRIIYQDLIRDVVTSIYVAICLHGMRILSLVFQLVKHDAAVYLNGM